MQEILCLPVWTGRAGVLERRAGFFNGIRSFTIKEFRNCNLFALESARHHSTSSPSRFIPEHSIAIDPAMRWPQPVLGQSQSYTSPEPTSGCQRARKYPAQMRTLLSIRCLFHKQANWSHQAFIQTGTPVVGKNDCCGSNTKRLKKLKLQETSN
jgi:hypothetical protein